MKKYGLSAAYRKYQYRRWIKSTLAQNEGKAHLHRLEEDIGAYRGFFEDESEGSFLRDLFESVVVGICWVFPTFKTGNSKRWAVNEQLHETPIKCPK